MYARTTKVMPGLITAMPFILVLFAWSGTHAQSQNSSSGKFAQFGQINTEDALSRLDQFALELRSHPEWRGIIVASNKSSSPGGTFLRLAHGYRNYLVNTRGIEDARVRLIQAEPKREMSFELWTLPLNQLSAVPERDPSLEPAVPQLFDQMWIGPQAKCFDDLSIELNKLSDGLRFLSEALKQQSKAKAWIVVHARPQESAATTRRTIDLSRRQLVKSGIKAERILTAVSSPRTSSCSSLIMWIVPASSPKADEAAHYSQLMDQAESARYTIRRVELKGEQRIGDSLLRKQFVPEQGGVFSRELLDQILKNINSLGSLYRVTLNDIEVSLDRDNELIDLAIYFRERRRR